MHASSITITAIHLHMYIYTDHMHATMECQHGTIVALHVRRVWKHLHCLSCSVYNHAEAALVTINLWVLNHMIVYRLLYICKWYTWNGDDFMDYSMSSLITFCHAACSACICIYNAAFYVKCWQVHCMISWTQSCIVNYVKLNHMHMLASQILICLLLFLVWHKIYVDGS